MSTLTVSIDLSAQQQAAEALEALATRGVLYRYADTNGVVYYGPQREGPKGTIRCACAAVEPSGAVRFLARDWEPYEKAAEVIERAVQEYNRTAARVAGLATG